MFATPHIPAQILYETDDYLLCYKPHSYATLPLSGSAVPSLFDWLIEVRPEQRDVLGYREGEAGIVYRLDNDTAGIVLVAKHAEAARAYREAQDAGAIDKIYLAKLDIADAKDYRQLSERLASSVVVKSGFRPRGPKGRWVEALELRVDSLASEQGLREGAENQSPEALEQGAEAMGIARNARTQAHSKRYTTHFSSVAGEGAWVEAHIQRGARHQIRVHCATGLGYPIVGDPLYAHGPQPWREPTSREQAQSKDLASLAMQPSHSAPAKIPLQLFCIGMIWRDAGFSRDLAYKLKNFII